MIDEIQTLLDQYMVWLKDKTALRQVKDWIEITTPYLDRHNDYLQIYAKRENGGFLLTDDSYTIKDLRISGCELESKKRKDFLTLTLNGFGVKTDGDALVVHASADNFAMRKHNLIQAMLALGQRGTIFMHRVILNTPLGYETDHSNGDGLDNRKENLRIATASQNKWNRNKYKNNTSGYKGVSWEKDRGRWRAYIILKTERIHLGYFNDKHEAARAYNAAAIKYHGEFACLNQVGE